MAKEYTSTHLAKSDKNLSLLLWFKGYRADPGAIHVKLT